MEDRLSEEPCSKDPLRSAIWKQETGAPSKTKGEQTNFAFRYPITPSSAKIKTNPHESLAFNRATTIAQRNLQRPASHTLQKRAVNQRYIRESQIIKRLKHALGSRAGLSLLYSVKHFNSKICNL